MQKVFDHIKNHYSLYTLLGLFLLLLIGLDGGRPFATPDEARYVEIPREMLEKNDFVTPRLNAMKYFEKPPLFYWMQAFVLKYFGMNEGVMRLNVMLCAFLGMAMIFFFTRKYIDKLSAIWSAIILATSGLYYALSRLIILDMPLTTCITGAFLSFYIAFESEKTKRRLLFYAFTTFCALGILIKGIVVLALLGPAILIWLSITKQWKKLFPLYLPSCVLLFFLIVFPWHYLAHIHNADFLHKYFYVEHFLRYTTTIHSRYQPIWFFIPILLASVTPWLTCIIEGFLNIPKKEKNLFLYLAIWPLWIFIFYSFANSKLVPYILPCIPPLAVIAGYGAANWYKDKEKFYLSRVGIFILGLIGIATLILPILNKDLFIGCEEIIPYAHITGGIFLTGPILLLINKKPNFSLFLHVFYAFSFIILANVAAPFIQKTSVKPLAQWIIKNKKPEDALVAFQNYYQDLPLYTQITPVVCVDDFNELDFGMEAELPKTKEWMLTSQEFVKKFKPGSGKNFWLITTQKRFSKLKHLVPNWNLKITATYKELLLIYHKG